MILLKAFNRDLFVVIDGETSILIVNEDVCRYPEEVIRSYGWYLGCTNAEVLE